MTALGLCLMLNASDYSDRLYAQINEDYWDEKAKLYREFWSSDKTETDPAFNWSVGVMLSALNARAMHDDNAKMRLREYLGSVRKYWNKRPPVPGFDVVPNPGGVDRYYDDNAWMTLALMESATVLNDSSLLIEAKGALDYALSGEDALLGGGIYWREKEKRSKNTCSNSPTAFACFVYARRTGDKNYDTHGNRILDWTLKTLLDPEDRLLWDNINLEGKVDKTKFSYNSALTARALAASGRRSEARTVFGNAWKRWKGTGRGMADTGRFAHLLIEAGLDLKFLSKMEARAVAADLEFFAPEHRFQGDWNASTPANRKRFELIDQASVLRFMELLK